MRLATRCQLIHGSDTYRSTRLLKAIEERFLRQQDSLVDFAVYDATDVSLDTLKQSLLAVPFFVQRRLFIIRNLLSAPKPLQEGFRELLSQVSDTTYIVLFEPKPCDKRLSLYTWLKSNVKVEECTPPIGLTLDRWVDQIALEEGGQLHSAARKLLTEAFGSDTWRLAHEIQKVVWSVASQGKTEVTSDVVKAVCVLDQEESVFQLTDALREAKMAPLVAAYQKVMCDHDPLLIAGALAGHIRTLTKLVLALESGVPSHLLAKETGLNPYVIKLNLALARHYSLAQMKQCYRLLVRFDASAKNGSVSPSLGLLLLLVRLHGTLNIRSQRLS